MNINLIFVILLVSIIIFIVRHNLYLALLMLGIIVVYSWYAPRFSTPRDFLNKVSTSVTELFSPCSNSAYCEDKDSDWTFLPEIMRSGEKKISSNPDNDSFLKNRLNTSTQLGSLSNTSVSMSSIMNNVPILSEFKIFLDKVITFIKNLPNDDVYQKEFLINKLQNKMAQVMLTANIAVTDMTLPENNYNEVLFAQRDFDSTMDIVGFITQDDTISFKLQQLHKEWSELCLRLNKFIISKVNDVKPEDYNILSGRLPDANEPIAANAVKIDYNL